MIADNIYREIETLLKSIIKNTEQLEQRNDNVSQLELDIIKADIRTLYQLYNKLDNVSLPVTEKIFISEKPAKKKEVKEKAEIVSEKQEPKIEEVKIIAEPEKEQEFTQEITITTDKDKDDDSYHQTINIKSDLFSLADNVTIADKFKDEKSSINDKLGQKKSDLSIAEKLNTKHTEDIKSLIGINEKFLFINELFEGNMTEYNNFISKVNTFNSLTEAHTYIDEEKEKRKWKDSFDSLSKLNKLLISRYTL